MSEDKASQPRKKAQGQEIKPEPTSKGTTGNDSGAIYALFVLGCILFVVGLLLLAALDVVFYLIDGNWDR